MSLLVLLGVGLGLLEVALLTLTQRLIPADVMARVYGLQETLTISAMALGSVAASGLVLTLGQRGALIGAGLLLPTMALLVLAHGHLLATGPTATNADFEPLHGVDPFSTLPVATVESLAVRADHQSVARGTDVVRQGDQGDCF